MTEKSAKPDKQLAKDVAIQLDRRRLRRRLAFYVALAAAIAAAIVYGTCGHGWGFGSGSGAGAGLHPIATIAADAGPRRCAIRITATGITVDGKPATRAATVAACKATAGADVVVTGEARQGDWDELRAALTAANVQVNTRTTR